MALHARIKVHETERDGEAERRVADRVCSVWKCRAVKRPGLNPTDFDLYRDVKIAAVMEARRRYCRKGHFRDYIIDRSKIAKLIDNAAEHLVGGFLCVQFDDVLLWMKPNEDDLKNTRLFTLNEPRDPGDVDDVVCVIRWDRFKELARGA